jgi:protein involved in polysaccharide export with SLBB domain
MLTSARFWGAGRSLLCAAVLFGCALSGGCSALGNPVANGVPVRRLSPDLLGESKANLELIPLQMLRQTPPDEYRIGPGDVLGVWVAGAFDEKAEMAPPITFSADPNRIPGVGYPVRVLSNGTITLGRLGTVNVKGLSIEGADKAIRALAVKEGLFAAGKEKVSVSLQQPREFRVLVIRQDSAGQEFGGGGNLTGRSVGFVVGFGGNAPRGARRGQGFALKLPAYENDLLNALARTGGFPGTDAQNEIIIERGSFKTDADRDALIREMENGGACIPGAGHRNLIRIPLRVRPGEVPNIRPEDIILEDGDIVYIEAREADVFYTGGLLPAGQFILPRDSDLDVLEAITLVGGILNAGTVNPANVQGQTVVAQLGSPSPSLLTVIRRLPNGGQVAIRVDLNRAMVDPRERILVQPRDMLILQERPQEAIARYFSNVFRYDITYRFLQSSRATGISTLTGP